MGDAGMENRWVLSWARSDHTRTRAPAVATGPLCHPAIQDLCQAWGVAAGILQRCGEILGDFNGRLGDAMRARLSFV
jgi:hypothetical protein